MISYEDVAEVLATSKVVPVVAVPRAELAVPLVDALRQGGLSIVEVTFRTPAAADSIESIRRNRPDVFVGAGTVLDLETARKSVELGVHFAVTPGFNPVVVDYFRANNVPIIPGVSTPTEIDMALNAGLKLLKFFPAEASGGVDYIKAVSAPYSEVQFMPTGGITINNIHSYLALPSVIACGGTWLATSSLISSGDFDQISTNVRGVREQLDSP